MSILTIAEAARLIAAKKLSQSSWRGTAWPG